MSELVDDLRARVRRVLLEDWDPHEVLGRPEGHGAYDAWVGPVAELLAAGAGEERLIDWLQERERETMCFPGLGRERLRRAARKLIVVGDEGKTKDEKRKDVRRRG